MARNGPRPTKHRDYFRIFGGAVLLSAISAGVQISQGTFGSGNQTTDSQDLREILAAGFAVPVAAFHSGRPPSLAVLASQLLGSAAIGLLRWVPPSG